MPVTPNGPKAKPVANSGGGYNPYDPKTKPQTAGGLKPPMWMPGKKPVLAPSNKPQLAPSNNMPAWYQTPKPQGPTQPATATPQQWKPSDLQAPAWLSGGAGSLGGVQNSGQFNNPYKPMPKPQTPSTSLNSQYGVQGNIFNPQKTPNVPTQISNAQPKNPNVLPPWISQDSPYQLQATENPTSLASQTGVYGIAPWLIPGPTQAMDNGGGGGGGYAGFGTRYKGWGGGGGGGGYGESPAWFNPYMNLYGWNFKG